MAEPGNPPAEGEPPAAVSSPDLPPAGLGEAPPPSGGPGQPDGANKSTPALKKASRKGPLAFLGELPVLLLVAFFLALLIKTFLVQAFYIPSESMVPTLNVGDRVLVNKVVYHIHSPRRGDIIVFSDPHPAVETHRNPASAFLHWLTEGLGVSTSPDKDFIKRVVGLPGEEVEMHRCVIYINGKPLNEPYLKGATFNNCEYGPTRVAANSLFVMGDNRDDSNDSRFQLGLIPYDKVIGRAFIVIWPPSRIGLLHGL
jgi:signal peptidase I